MTNSRVCNKLNEVQYINTHLCRYNG